MIEIDKGVYISKKKFQIETMKSIMLDELTDEFLDTIQKMINHYSNPYLSTNNLINDNASILNDVKKYWRNYDISYRRDGVSETSAYNYFATMVKSASIRFLNKNKEIVKLSRFIHNRIKSYDTRRTYC